MTPEQEIEWKKCAKDFKYFAKHYLLINHPARGLVPFDLYPFQERVLDQYEKHRMNILSKFRQGGLTTLSVLYMLWKCMFKLDQLVLVMSKTDREAIKAGRIVTKALQHIKYNHPWLYPELSVNTHHEKNFVATGSFLEFRTIKAARGQSLTYIVIDEAAFIQGMDEAWKDMYPTVSAGGNVIIISTVNGMGNWYQQMFHDAVNKRNTFNVIDIDYMEHPEYRDPEWVKQAKANMRPREWAQEFERSFLHSGNTFFTDSVLSELDKNTRFTYPMKKLFPEWDTDKNLTDGNDEVQWEKGALWVWEPPLDGHEYIVAVDAAEGVGDDGDNSAFQILDSGTLTQVAEFSSNAIPPHQLAMVVVNIASTYNLALVVVENGGPGLTVLDKLENNLYYENIFYQQLKKVEKPGIVISKTTRPLILNSFQDYLQGGLVKINSARLSLEMKMFIFDREKKRAEAPKGHHDDTIISMAIALHIRDRVVREIPMGAALPATIADSHLTSIYEKIRQEIESITPEDLLERSEEKQPWEQDDMLTGVKLGFTRPFESLLREFDF